MQGLEGGKKGRGEGGQEKGRRQGGGNKEGERGTERGEGRIEWQKERVWGVLLRVDPSKLIKETNRPLGY